MARLARLLPALIWCAACGAQDPRSELMEIAASDPAPRSREITACMYDSVAERHGSAMARQIVEMARANARGEALPSEPFDAHAVLALSLQEAVRCAERFRVGQGAPDTPPRSNQISRGPPS